MPVNLRCPACGAVAGADAWATDAEVRGLFALVTTLPAPVLPELLPYLALFRPKARSLSWRRAKRVTQDLAEMVKKPGLSWERRPVRPCPPALWAEAMRLVTERGPERPLRNHNYLRAIAYELSDRADARREKDTEAARRARGREGPDAGPEQISDADVEAMLADTRRKLGINGGGDGIDG